MVAIAKSSSKQQWKKQVSLTAQCVEVQ